MADEDFPFEVGSDDEFHLPPDDESLIQAAKPAQGYQKHLVPSGDDSRKLVILVPRELAASGFDLIKLPHPRTGALQKYALSREQKGEPRKLYELQKMQKPQGSWFVREHKKAQTNDSNDGNDEKDFALSDGYVISKGALLLATPIDPTFIALRSLMESAVKKKGEFLSYNDIVTFDAAHSAELHVLTGDIDLLFDGINAVCDTFDVGDEAFYKYSEAKAVEWLKVKTEAVKDALKEPGCPLAYLAEAGSFSASYRRENGIHMNDFSLTSAALGFLSEYVPQELLATFASKGYGISDYRVPKNTGFATAAASATSYAASTKGGQYGGYKRDYHHSSSSSYSKPPQNKVNLKKYSIQFKFHFFI